MHPVGGEGPVREPVILTLGLSPWKREESANGVLLSPLSMPGGPSAKHLNMDYFTDPPKPP